MRRVYQAFILLVPFFFIALAAFPPPYDFTSSQEGDWTVSSTWNEGGAPSCGTSQEILIDGDTVTADCDLDLSGSGYILIRNEGYLKVKGDLEVSGQAELEVGSNAGMRVEGDMTVSGEGDLTLNGEVEATGDLELNGANATADGGGELTLGGTGCSNFTGSGECNESTPLPVELLEFQAQASDEGIRLNWSTASEQRNDHFIIQRSSNGSLFKKIGQVAGNGTTNQRHDYRYLDESPPAGDQYYRLIQVDLDGKTEEYGPRTASYEASEGSPECEMKIVPNPCRGNCKVRFSDACEGALEKEDLRVQVFDVAGNKVSADMQKGSGFGSEFMLDTKEPLTPGVYVVRAVSDKGQVASEKMKKE